MGISRAKGLERGNRLAIKLGVAGKPCRGEGQIEQRRAAGVELVHRVGERVDHTVDVVGDGRCRTILGIAGKRPVGVARVNGLDARAGDGGG